MKEIPSSKNPGCPLATDREARLFDLLAGELDPATRGELQAHVDACPACREALAAVRRGDETLRGFRVLPPEADLVPQVMQRVGPFSPPDSGRLPIVWKILGLLLIVLGVFLVAFHREPPLSPPAGTETAKPSAPSTGIASPALPVPGSRPNPVSVPVPGPVAGLPAATVRLVAGQGRWEPALPLGDQAVPTPTSLRTGPESCLEMSMDSGVRVVAGPGTSLVMRSHEVALDLGEAWFEVAPREAGHPPFAVMTGRGRLEVVGTRFGVRVQASETVVVLIEGGLRWQGPGGTLVLAAAQRLTVTPVRVVVENLVSAELESWNRLASGVVAVPGSPRSADHPEVPIVEPAPGTGLPASPREILDGHSLKKPE